MPRDLFDAADGNRRKRLDTEPKAPDPTERRVQRAIVDGILRKHLRPDWRFTHFPAGGERPAEERLVDGEPVRVSVAAIQLARDGLMPGWPDLQLLAPWGVMHFLEVKRSAKAEWSDEQRAFQAYCHAHGIPHRWAWNTDMAWAAFDEWNCCTIKRAGGGIRGI
jgi:hypothetical protein